MGAYSKEFKSELNARVRAMMVRKPNITPTQAVKVLASGEYPMKLGYSYVNNVMKKIRRERAHRFDWYLLGEVLGKYEDTAFMIIERAWVIATDKNSTNNEKLSAMSQVRETMNDLMERYFNSGVLEKKLGTMEITEKKISFSMILNQLDENTRQVLLTKANELIRSQVPIQEQQKLSGEVRKYDD